MTAQAGFFLDTSSAPIDLRGATVNGKLSFEVWSDSPDGVNLNVAVDCPTYPNAGSPVLLEGVGAQKWEEISIPAASLFNESCALRNDQIGTIPMFLTNGLVQKSESTILFGNVNLPVMALILLIKNTRHGLK